MVYLKTKITTLIMYEIGLILKKTPEDCVKGTSVANNFKSCKMEK